MDINERIFSILKNRGIKNKELSEGTGIATSTISEWKKGVNLKPDMIIRVAEFLKLSTDYLLTGKEKSFTFNHGLSMQSILLGESTNDIEYGHIILTEEEKHIIIRHRKGNILIVDKDLQKLKGDVGELSELEIDLILKLRNLDQRVQEDVYDNLCWRYEREHHKKISYESKIG